jgi:hypothetical protein
MLSGQQPFDELFSSPRKGILELDLRKRAKVTTYFFNQMAKPPSFSERPDLAISSEWEAILDWDILIETASN